MDIEGTYLNIVKAIYDKPTTNKASDVMIQTTACVQSWPVSGSYIFPQL